MMIHAVTNDLLSDIKIEDIKEFEKELYSYMDNNHQELIKNILAGKDFTNELTDAINEFKRKFK